MKIERIEIIGREWWRKSAGGHYQTAEIWINDEFICKTTATNCFGDHYLTEAFQELDRRGLVKMERHSNGSFSPLWRYCEENGIKYRAHKIEVSRERDL